MKTLFTKGHWGFLALLFVIAVPLFWRAFWLRQVYFDSGIRAQVQSAVSLVAEREGWLLSDVSLQGIDVTNEPWVQITYRNHIRGEDPLYCNRIRVNDASLYPCDE